MKLRQSAEGTPLPESMIYFLDLWEDLSSGGTILQESAPSIYAADIFTTHAFLLLMEDELHFNGIRNQGIRALFRERLSEGLTWLFTVSPSAAHGVKLVVDSMTLPDGRLLASVREALRPFADRTYAKDLLKALEVALSTEVLDEKGEAQLRNLSNELISEFLIKGYSLKAIAEFEWQLQAGYEHDTGWTTALAPHAGRVRAVVQFLNENLEASAKRLNVIFAVVGFKGSAEVAIGDVKIYNALQCPKLQENRLGRNESFSGEGINIVVPVSAFDNAKALFNAWHKAHRALDCVHGLIEHGGRMKVLRENYLIADENWKAKASGSLSDRDGPLVSSVFALDTKRLAKMKAHPLLPKRSEILDASAYGLSDKELKLRESLAWLRKGDLASRDDDALLYYWIGIEKLFTFNSPWSIHSSEGRESVGAKWELIATVIPSMIALKKAFGFDFEFHEYLFQVMGASINEEPVVQLPQTFTDRFGLRALASSFDRFEFVQHLREIENSVACKLLKGYARDLRRFYTERGFAHKRIGEWKADASRDLQIVYRYRNSIVHNAHADLVFLPRLRAKARQMLNMIIEVLLEPDDVEEKGGDDVQAKLFATVNQFNRLEFELKNDKAAYLARELGFWQ